MCNGKIYAGVFTEVQRSCAKGKITLDMDKKNSKIIANLQVKGQTNKKLKESVTVFLKQHFSDVEVSILPLSRFQCMFDKHVIVDKSL